jgi:cytochrome oxidase Cu insertion factor (SCO1/SenC/PrrC family)
MPAFVAGHKSYGAKSLTILAIARDGSPAEIAAFAEKFGIAFPILENRGKRFSSLYRVISTPTLIIIGPDGVVDSAYTSGEINYLPVLMAKIRSLVRKVPPQR